MTYIFQCDGFCGGRVEKETRPALTAEFSEQWFKTSQYADYLKQQGYEPGDLVTLCGDCLHKLLIEHE